VGTWAARFGRCMPRGRAVGSSHARGVAPPVAGHTGNVCISVCESAGGAPLGSQSDRAAGGRPLAMAVPKNRMDCHAGHRIGQTRRRAAIWTMFMPDSSSAIAQPKITSSISFGAAAVRLCSRGQLPRGNEILRPHFAPSRKLIYVLRESGCHGRLGVGTVEGVGRTASTSTICNVVGKCDARPSHGVAGHPTVAP
jgi:hypothetical protein